MNIPSFKAHPTQHSPAVRTAFIELQRAYQEATLTVCMRHDCDSIERLNTDLPLVKEVVLELQKTPPLGLVLDCMNVWREGRQWTPRTSTHVRTHPLYRTLLRLQNEWFYRLIRMPLFLRIRERWLTLSDRSIQRSQDSVHPLPTHEQLSLRDRALVFLTGQLLSCLVPHFVESFRPHALTSSESSPIWLQKPQLAIQTFEAHIAQPGWLKQHIHVLLEHILQLPDEAILPTSCEEIIVHFEQVPNKLQRIQWQHMSENAERIPPSTQLQMFFSLRDAGYRELKLPTQNSSLEGGFHGISRKGPIENMLHSELLFWEPNSSTDLFSLRWSEHELLYYEREQKYTYTWERQITILLDLDPYELRFKGSHSPTSGYTLLMGWLGRVLQTIRQICPQEVIRFNIHLGPSPQWDKDADLLQLFFTRLPHIGASIQFYYGSKSLLEQIHQPARTGELRWLISSGERWESELHASEPKPCYHHIHLICAATRPAHLNPVLSSMAPVHPVEQQSSSVQHYPERSELSQIPHFQWYLDEDEGLFMQLAQLRDRVVESILKTSLIS